MKGCLSGVSQAVPQSGEEADGLQQIVVMVVNAIRGTPPRRPGSPLLCSFFPREKEFLQSQVPDALVIGAERIH